MNKVDVEMLTDQGNNAVLRLPGRKYPGVLVQGDSLNALVGTIREALSAVEAGQTSEAADILRSLALQFEDVQERFEGALSRYGIQRPY